MWPQLLAAVAFAVASFLRRSLGPAVPRRQAKAWEEAAAAVGMTRVERTAGSLSGWKGRLNVRLTRYDRSSEQGTEVRISGPALGPTLTLRPEGADDARRRARGWQEVEVGDASFDRACWVEGPALEVRAILGADARRAVLSLFEGYLVRPRLAPFYARGRVEQGVLRIELPEARSEGRDPLLIWDYSASLSGGLHFTDALRAALELAERLATPPDAPLRIAENLKSEPLPGVRLQCLTALVREHPDHPLTRAALLAAREDPDAEVRLRAGAALGAEGRELLLRLALGDGSEDATTDRAVTALGEQLTLDEATAILRNALRARREATARSAMGVLAHRGGEEAIHMIARVLAVERGPLAHAAASTLGLTGSPLAEEPLLAALRSADASLRVTATRALGQVGTVSAVTPLRELEAGDSALRVEARQAIARIQSRIAGASPGQLSLAGGEAGQLSFVEGEAGRLSLARPEKTRD
jgi:HEAT repeat protein